MQLMPREEPTGAVAALNKNLDLNITEYVSVDFNAVMEVVDALGGIELDITKEEASNMHIWIDEMNEVMGTHGKPVSGTGRAAGQWNTGTCLLP